MLYFLHSVNLQIEKKKDIFTEVFCAGSIDPYICKKTRLFHFLGFSEEETKNVIVFQCYKLLYFITACYVLFLNIITNALLFIYHIYFFFCAILSLYMGMQINCCCCYCCCWMV